MENLEEQTQFFSRRVRERIEPALTAAITQCDQLETRIREYQELDETLELLQSSPGSKQKSLAEVGEGYRMKADLDLSSPIYLEIGLNFYLPLPLPIAREVLKSKLSLLQRQLILSESRKEIINRDYVESLYTLDSLRQLAR